MAVPKKRTSSARRDKRRKTHKAAGIRLNECPRCHSPRRPHRVCHTCGTYAGREVIAHEIGQATRPPALVDDDRPRRPRSRAGARVLIEARDEVAAEGITVRVFGEPSELADDRVGRRGRGVRGDRADRQRRGARRRSPPQARRLDRPRRRRCRRGQRRRGRQRRLDRRDPDRLDARPAPDERRAAARACPAAGGPRAASARRPCSSTSAPTPRPVPADLAQYGFLGSAFSQAVLGIESPRVALLSIGEEAKKGTPRVIEAHEVLAAAAGHRVHRQRRGS